MRRWVMSLAAAVLFVSPMVIAQAPAEKRSAADEQAARLPVRRVVLYKAGVGYFEHLGRVRGTQAVTITFTSAQLDDVLNSLTTLDLGGGRITSVSYNSEAPLAQRLGALRLPLGEQTTLAQFFGALRGARLEVQTGGAVITGRLLSVERRPRGSGDQITQRDELSIVTDAGDVRTVELTPAVSVRIAERDMADQVGRYLGLLASTRAQDTRRMVVTSAGSGDRQLFVSYISEVPIWKTTYRIVLPSKPDGRPLLQGWAIVDNTVGEDWEQVELALVAGAPQSFIQQISQPYYARRPVVPLPESVLLTPQAHSPTLASGTGRVVGRAQDESGAILPGVAVHVLDAGGQAVATAVTGATGRYEISGIPPGRYTVRFQLPGFRSERVEGMEVEGGTEIEQSVTMGLTGLAEHVTVSAEAPRSRVGGGARLPGRAPAEAKLEAGDIEARMAELQAVAVGRELGDLFEYKLKEPVTIRKNQSAMVPIANTEIAAERVSLWNAARGSAQPLRALWLTNTSPLTLDGGSFTVLDEETFAGEGLVDPLKPGEKRLLSYAVDLAVRVDTKRDSERQRVTRVRLVRGVMIHHREERERRTYTIRNEDKSARAVVVEHPLRPGWKLATGVAAPAESSADAYRFKMTVDPQKTASLVVDEARPIETEYAISQLTDEQVALFIRERSINPQIEQALRPILAKKSEIAGLAGELGARQAEVNRIGQDQQRIRENMKALRGSAEEKALLQRYTRQLDEQETRLETLHGEMAQLDGKRRAAQAELNRLIEALALDVTLGG